MTLNFDRILLGAFSDNKWIDSTLLIWQHFITFVYFYFQDLLLGDFCCVDIMGSTQFHTSRANWDKRCCSNAKGPVVPIPADLSEQDVKKIDKQIGRMPDLKQVGNNYFLDF